MTTQNSTIVRARKIKAIIDDNFVPHNYLHSMKNVYIKHVRSLFGISYATFVRYVSRCAQIDGYVGQGNNRIEVQKNESIQNALRRTAQSEPDERKKFVPLFGNRYRFEPLPVVGLLLSMLDGEILTGKDVQQKTGISTNVTQLVTVLRKYGYDIESTRHKGTNTRYYTMRANPEQYERLKQYIL